MTTTNDEPRGPRCARCRGLGVSMGTVCPRCGGQGVRAAQLGDLLAAVLEELRAIRAAVEAKRDA